ncbi:uncharacterized protein SCDLUD_001322 [Saccharomycodes ludwigii]|uniref:uncharacterized protein n=1 Tax=Saccharomycodes ludwigii TaxID=36035 RepID=UPI001E896772|nr:hypothetical protein SCDLUD_001322 [Saccharomycodes ludwigii]KAH3901560.1 hypothetical protein SCDLUD_001322 [Saccharomycodes ludwigii]
MTKVSRIDVNNQDGETEEGLTEISLRPICTKKVLRVEIKKFPNILYDTGADFSIVNKSLLHNLNKNTRFSLTDFNKNIIDAPYVGDLFMNINGNEIKFRAVGVTNESMDPVISRASLKECNLIVNEQELSIKNAKDNSFVGNLKEREHSIYFPGNWVVPPNNISVRTAKSKEKFNLDHIHVLLGHVNVKDLQRSFKSGCLVGINYDDIDWSNVNSFGCVTCMQGKSRYKNHIIGSRAIAQQYYEVGEYFHSDLFGSVSNIKKGYYHSFISFTDEKSKFKFVYGLKSKSAEAILKVLKVFVPYVEKHLGKSIKYIQTDNGLEYKNRLVMEYLRKFGIKLLNNTAGDSRGNGVAERLNLTLLNDARTLMGNTNLPRHLWFYAVLFSCYVRNGIIAASNDTGCSPRELMSIPKLNVAKILPFGSHVILHHPTHDKIEKRGLDAYVLAPSESSFGYLVWVPSLMRIVDSSSISLCKSPFNSGECQENVIDEFIDELISKDDSLDSNRVEPLSSQTNESHNESAEVIPATDQDSSEQIIPIITDYSREDSHEEYQGNEYDGDTETTSEEALDVDEANTESSVRTDSVTDTEEYVPSDGIDVAVGRPQTTVNKNEKEVDDVDIKSNEVNEHANTESVSDSNSKSDSDSKSKSDSDSDSDSASNSENESSDSPRVIDSTNWVVQTNNKKRKMTTEEIFASIQEDPSMVTARKRLKIRLAKILAVMESARNNSADVKHIRNETLYLHEVYRLSDPNIKNQYLMAMQKEIEVLEGSNTWDSGEPIPVDSVDQSKIVPLLILFNVKRSGKYKCRICARGDVQDATTYEDSLSSSNLAQDGLMFLLNMVLTNSWHLGQLDIQGAYLNAPINTELYVKAPKVYGYKNMLFKLRKSLYGLRQSGYLWNQEISSFLIQIGFQEIEFWPSLYQKNYDGVEGIKHTILLGLFVDDMVVVSSKECDFKELVAMLNTRYTVKTVNDGGEPIYDILGLEIEYKVGSHLSMTMGKSLEEKLPKLGFNLSDKVTSLPLVYDFKLPEKLKIDSVDLAEKIQKCRKAVGLLNYVVGKYRPDINFVVNVLASYQLYPTEEIMKLLHKTINYLWGTRNHKLIWRYDDIIKGNFKIIVDASHGNREKFQSQYGYMVYMNNLLVGYKTGTTSIACMSSTEAETYVVNEASLKFEYWIPLLEEYYSEITKELYCDNQSAIKLCKADTFVKFRDKFHGIRAYRARQQMRNIGFDLKFVESKSNPADVLTKFAPHKDNIKLFMKNFEY